MAETVGLLILSAAGATTSVTGIGTASAIVIADVAISVSTVATVVGATAITVAAIGLQYALSNPNVPKPENGAQPLKQALPARQRGYWINRLGGYYMLFLAAGGDSQDVLAFHSGRIEEALQLYLHDTPVSVSGGLGHGQYATVISPTGIYYQNVSLQIFYGTDTQNSSDVAVNVSNTSGVWTSAYAGKGIACICLNCGHASDPEQFTKIYPQGLPLPSIVAKCAPVWDPRDVTQTEGDRASWKASPNPVLQLLDYLTEPDGGMGEERSIILPPAALAQWMAEADLCDADVGGRARYESAGFYQFDNSPENVITKILATCDGWLAEAGDGSLVLTVGVYREPSDPPLTEEHIVGFTVRKGQPDEETINQLDVTFTNPDAGYVTDQVDSIRDEDAISLTGGVRAKPLDLSWVQNAGQAAALGRRGMLRLNPKASGTFVTTLYGMRYLGKRWIKVQFPNLNGGDVSVVEIQDRAQVDLLGGRVTFSWNLIDPIALAALDGATSPTSPALLRQDGSAYLREDGSTLNREA
ncbi:phage tail protein [Bradyrhizobium ottawaense]|uniref:phage tail protein n=1 Tax=Bradyrhizobium ottawaense TaxID=931866 RepID=UPI00271516BA|nr:phage tail protein [Bradyrhizobium ottawaense]WLB43011.1 phage tail protein [Bradyrhizobium ottawaense]